MSLDADADLGFEVDFCRYVYPAAHQVDAATEHARLKKVRRLDFTGVQNMHCSGMPALSAFAARRLVTKP